MFRVKVLPVMQETLELLELETLAILGPVVAAAAEGEVAEQIPEIQEIRADLSLVVEAVAAEEQQTIVLLQEVLGEMEIRELLEVLEVLMQELLEMLDLLVHPLVFLD
jgi:hypothetical protein